MLELARSLLERRSRIEVDSTQTMGKESHDEVAWPSVDMTSKIKSQADLFWPERLLGEAMPIASVSILTFLTAQEGAAYRTKLVAKGGEIEEVEPATTQRDQDHRKTFNTPARLIKETAGRAIPYRGYLNRLSWPILRLPYSINDGKEMTKTAGLGSPASDCGCLWPCVC